MTAISAHAQLIAYDGLNYSSAPPSNLSGDNGGLGAWAGPWADENSLTAVVPGMSYAGLPVSGNSFYGAGGPANPTYGSSSEAERVLTYNFGDFANGNSQEANTLWMSFLWNGQPGSHTGSYYRQATMMFLAGGTPSAAASGTEMFDIGMPNIKSSNVTNVSPNVSMWASHDNLDPNAPGSTSPIQSSVAANVNASDFILVEFTSASAWVSGTAQTVNVWVNPTIGGTLGTADMTYSLQDFSGINAIRIQAGGYNASYGGAGQEQVDEIRLGYTANQVETLSVPEPTSMAFMGLAALGLVLFRRRK